MDASGKPYAADGRYGLYFRERLGGARPSHVEPESTGREPAERLTPAAAPRGRSWWWLVLVALVVGLVLGALLAHASELTRVELFDTKGHRTGYATVDRETGRVDYYDVNSRRTGWGRAERFDLDGKRQESTVLPIERKGTVR